MAIQATILASRLDLTLGEEMTPEDHSAARALYEKYRPVGRGVIECREHDDKPDLASYRCAGTYRGDRFGDRDGTRCPRGSGCGRVHGAWLYLRSAPDMDGAVLVFAHQGTNDPALKSDDCHGQIQSVETRSGQHLIYHYATDEYGWPAKKEARGVGTRADVLFECPVGTLVSEIQWSKLATATARRRDNRHVKQGNIPIWTLSTGSGLVGHAVAQYTTNAFPRTTDKAATDNWWVPVPFRTLDKVRCTVDYFDHCPDRRRGGWCDGRHWYAWPNEDESARCRVIEQVGRLGEGHTRRLDTNIARLGVLLVDAESYRRWEDDGMLAASPPPEPPERVPHRCSSQWDPEKVKMTAPEEIELPAPKELPAPPPPGPAEQLALELPASSLPPGAGHPHPGSPAAHEAAEDFAPTALVMEGSRAYYAARRGWSSASDRRLRESLTAAQLAYLDHLLALPVDSR